MRATPVVPVFYTPKQSVDKALMRTFSPSASKPALVMRAYRGVDGGAIYVHDFEPVTEEDLARVHDLKHVQAILNGSAANGFGSADVTVAESFLYTVGSFVHAATYAAAHGGLVHSPTSGFHHAGPDTAQGFCTFNGLALAARVLRDDLSRDVGILDLDMHYGNGTAACLDLNGDDAGNHVEDGPDDKRGLHPIRQVSRDWTDGEQCLRDLPGVLDSFQYLTRGSGVLLYQAGADSHIHDPYGGYLSTEQMARRDQVVFDWCVARGVPCVWNLAGGYQRDAKAEPTPVIDLHLNTLRAAYRALGAK